MERLFEGSSNFDLSDSHSYEGQSKLDRIGTQTREFHSLPKDLKAIHYAILTNHFIPLERIGTIVDQFCDYADEVVAYLHECYEHNIAPLSEAVEEMDSIVDFFDRLVCQYGSVEALEAMVRLWEELDAGSDPANHLEERFMELADFKALPLEMLMDHPNGNGLTADQAQQMTMSLQQELFMLLNKIRKEDRDRALVEDVKRGFGMRRTLRCNGKLR